MYRIVITICDHDCPFRDGATCGHPKVPPNHERLPKKGPLPSWCPHRRHDTVISMTRLPKTKRSTFASKPRTPMPPVAHRIVRLVATYTGVTEKMILGSDKSKQVVAARDIVCWCIRAYEKNASYPDIGRWLGRDHSSIVASVRRAEAAARMSVAVREVLSAVSSALAGGEDPYRCPACDAPLDPALGACKVCPWPDLVPIELAEEVPPRPSSSPPTKEETTDV